MADWPDHLSTLPAGIITPASLCACGDLFTAAGKSGSTALWQTVVWPTANTAVYVPFYLETPVTVYQLGIYNGAVVSGNFDVGIYDALGTRLVSAGSTAQVGVSVLQMVNTTDTLLAPGQYFLATNVDNTTATVFQAAPAFILQNAYGIQTQAVGSVTLPSTATFANPASTNKIPCVVAALNPVI